LGRKVFTPLAEKFQQDVPTERHARNSERGCGKLVHYFVENERDIAGLARVIEPPSEVQL
jgi:hypothetical protein